MVFIILIIGALFFIPNIFPEKYVDGPAIFVIIVLLLTTLYLIIRKRYEVVFSVKAIVAVGISVLIWAYSIIFNVFTHYHLLVFTVGCIFFIKDNQQYQWPNLKVTGLIVVCIALVECFWSWTQLLSENDSSFRHIVMTGSFENTMGLALFLAVGAVFNLSLFSEIKLKWIKVILSIPFIIIAITIFYSGSRAGVISLTIVLVSHLVYENILKRSFCRKYRWGIIAIGLIGCFSLYMLKKDSAEGRLLIWNITTKMILDKPWGFGIGGFNAHYMNYQVDYFKTTDNEYLVSLANNIYEPFNEYLKIGVEFGIIILLLFLFWIIKIWRSSNDGDEEIHGKKILMILLLFCLVSYPLKYPFVWVILGYALSLIARGKKTTCRLKWYYVFPIYFILTGIVIYNALLSYQWKKAFDLSAKSAITKELIMKYENLIYLDSKNPIYIYNYASSLYSLEDYEKSISILEFAQNNLSNYDLSLLLGYNYYRIEDYDLSERYFENSHYMCPNRFIPLYHLLKVYEKTKDNIKADSIAHIIYFKPVKIESPTIKFIKQEALERLVMMPDNNQ